MKYYTFTIILAVTLISSTLFSVVALIASAIDASNFRPDVTQR